MLRDATRQMAGPTVEVLAPGVAISLTVLSINIVGDWLRDVWDPRPR
jgi:peptide/nickel transport system permease protein